MDRWQKSNARMEWREKKDDGDEGGLMVNKADGWTANRGEARKTRRSQNRETKSGRRRE